MDQELVLELPEPVLVLPELGQELLELEQELPEPVLVLPELGQELLELGQELPDQQGSAQVLDSVPGLD